MTSKNKTSTGFAIEPYGALADLMRDMARVDEKPNTVIVAVTQGISGSSSLTEFAKLSDTRIVVGGRVRLGGGAADALRVTKSDLKGLGRHKALVAAGTAKAIVSSFAR